MSLSLIHIYHRHGQLLGVDAADIAVQAGAQALGRRPVSYTHLDVYKRQGLDIPGRISLLGYDDIEYASLPKIRLSTLAQPTGCLLYTSPTEFPVLGVTQVPAFSSL